MNRGLHDTSGFNIDVSEHEDLRAQLRDAARFLADHRQELLTLGRQPAIEGMILDFGCFVPGEHAVRFYRFPSELTRAAGELGIDIEHSVYSAGSDGN